MRRLENIAKSARNVIAGVALSAILILSANAQSYDADFKVRELSHGTGTNIAGTNISLFDSANDIQYIGKTDANGVAIIPQIQAGNYKVRTSKTGYIEFVKKNYTLYGNKQINVSLIPKHIIGPNNYWEYDFDLAFFNASVPEIFGGGGRNPAYFDHVLPIYTRIEGATQSDSIKIASVKDTINKYVGFEVFKIINNSVTKDTTYTMYVNSNTNTSNKSTDVNNVLLSGWSKITSTDPLKKAYHEMHFIFGEWPGLNYDRITILNGQLQTMPDLPQTCDYADTKIILDQGLAIKRGEQNTFNMSEMKEFVADVTPNGTVMMLPVNNAVNLTTSVEFKAKVDTLARKYQLQVSKNSLFTDIIFDGNVFRNDTILNNLPAGTQLYARENVSNSIRTSAWSPTITFSTTSAIIYPGQALIDAPSNNATKVGTPVPYSVNAPNATSYRILAARDLGFLQMLKDTIVNVTNPTIPLPNGTIVYTKAIGINANGSGPESVVVMYTTIKAKPTSESVTFPLNNATEVTQPTNYTNSVGANAEKHEWQLLDIYDSIMLDTIPTNPGFTYDKLPTNKTFKAKVRGINTDQTGDWSQTIIYTMFDYAPSTFDINLVNNATVVYVIKKLAIPSTPATDVDNNSSELSKNFHITGPSIDTIMHANNIETIYLDSARLKLDSQYTVSAEVTDGKKTTPANETKTFKTPKATTGIENIFQGGDFLIYPNPTNYDITLEYYLLQNLKINIYLYNMDGKKLICQSFDKTSGSQSRSINLTLIGKGIFILKLVTLDAGKERLIKTFKLIRN